MYNALPNSFDTDLKDFQIIKNSIDMNKFFQPNISHYEYVLDKKLVVSPNDPHPSAEGHQQFADMIIQYITDNKIL